MTDLPSEASPADSIRVLSAGDGVRVCIQYKETLRSLLWLHVLNDGSLLTGYSTPPTGKAARLHGRREADGAFTFSWGDGARRDELDPRDHFSFHASGLVNSHGNHRSFGVDLRLLTNRTLLCNYLPSHPDRWRIIDVPRRSDIVIAGLLMDECPLSVDLFYQPAGDLRLLESRLESGSYVLPIGFRDVEGHGRVVLHLRFQRQVRAASWPPRSIIAWPIIAGRVNRSDVEEWIEPGR